MAYSSTTPSHQIDPKLKGKDWCRKFIKSYYDLYYSQPIYDRMRLNRLYGASLQPQSIYGKMLTPRDGKQSTHIDANGNDLGATTGSVEHYINTNYEIQPFMAKFKDVLINYVSKQDFDIYCDAISPISSDEREQIKHDLWAKKQVNEDLAFLEDFGVPNDTQEETLPDTLDELEIIAKFGIRLGHELKMEQAIQMAFYENDFERQKRNILNDATDYGYITVKIECDAITKKPIIEYVDTATMRGNNIKDLSKSTFLGQIKPITVGQVRAEAGDQFTEQEYQDMATKCGYVGMFDKNRLYDNQDLIIFDCQFDSYDIKKYRLGENRGNDFIVEVGYNSPTGVFQVKTDDGLLDREVKEVSVKTIYGGKLIIGTDYIYDWGKARDIPRNYENKRECFKKFFIYKIADRSLVDRCRGYLDDIQIAYIKKQNAIMRARANGFTIDLDKLDNLMLDGVQKSSADIIRAHIQTGIGMYRGGSMLDDEGRPMGGNPFEYHDGGVGNLLTELYMEIDANINKIRQVTGINESMDSSDPMASTAVGTQKIALSGAQNAIYHYFDAMKFTYENVAMQSGLIIQMSARNRKLKGYSPAIGNGYKKLLELGDEVSFENDGVSLVVFGYRIEARPSEIQKQEMKEYAKLALTSAMKPSEGGIELPQLMMINRMVDSGVNLKMVEIVLMNEIRKYKEQQQKVAQENSANESKNRLAEIESGKASALEVQKATLETTIAIDNNKANNEAMLLEKEYQLKAQLSVVDGKVKENNQNQQYAI